MTDLPLSDLDTLMADDPLNLSNADIDAIIARQRDHRANLAAGVKPARKGKATPGAKIDLKALGLMKEQPKPKVIVGMGIRRI